jgi:hypothetical protein
MDFISVQQHATKSAQMVSASCPDGISDQRILLGSFGRSRLVSVFRLRPSDFLGIVGDSVRLALIETLLTVIIADQIQPVKEMYGMWSTGWNACQITRGAEDAKHASKR